LILVLTCFANSRKGWVFFLPAFANSSKGMPSFSFARFWQYPEGVLSLLLKLGFY
jgi:hypothetical protein